MLANHISHTLIHLVGKIKIENFHVIDTHWLYRTSRYAIVKVDVTERNDVTKCHGNCHHNLADICNQSDCIIKKEMKGMQEKESVMGVRDR